MSNEATTLVALLGIGLVSAVLGWMFGKIAGLRDGALVERACIAEWMRTSADELITRGILRSKQPFEGKGGTMVKDLRWDSAAEAIETAAVMIEEGAHGSV